MWHWDNAPWHALLGFLGSNYCTKEVNDLRSKYRRFDVHKIRVIAFQDITFDTACFLQPVSPFSIQISAMVACLCCVVEYETGRAFHIEISSISQRVMWADYDLEYRVSARFFPKSAKSKQTNWLLPGSLTVANCSSLYFSNAGPSWDTRVGLSIVRALISIMTCLELEIQAVELCSYQQ